MSDLNDNWKIRVLVGGTVLGAVTGLAAGYLFSRTAEEKNETPPKLHTMDAIKVIVGVIGVVRGIAALGEGD